MSMTLIAHSMGGVASREYVQGDFYNVSLPPTLDTCLETR